MKKHSIEDSKGWIKDFRKIINKMLKRISDKISIYAVCSKGFKKLNLPDKSLISICLSISLIASIPVNVLAEDELNQQRSIIQRNFNFQPNNFIIQKPTVTSQLPDFIPESTEPLTNYLLSVGDNIQIHLLSKDIEFEYPLAISPEGKIFIPKIGEFNALGLSTSQLKENIIKKIGSRLKDFQVSVILSKIHQIKVFITGYASKPGTYTLNYDTRLLEFLRQIEGITENGSLRNIEISSKNQKKNYDLYNFVYKGIIDENPKLKTGDKIFISYISKKVAVVGNAIHPGIYEFKEKEGISDIIKLSGGITNGAAIDKITLWKDGMNHISDFSNGTVIKNINDKSQSKLDDGDIIFIPALKQPQEDSQVNLYGQVNKPGSIPYKEGTKFSYYLKASGGASYVADLEKVKVTRTKNVDGKMTSQVFTIDANDILYNGNSEKDIFIEPNDVIFIPERFFNFRNFNDITSLVLSTLGIVSLVISFIRN